MRLKLSFLLVTLVMAFRIWNQEGYTDFIVFYRSAERALSGQFHLIYDLAVNGNSPYRYFPGSYFLFAPLTFFNERIAKFVWFFIQSGCFYLGFQILGRSISKGKHADLGLFLGFLMSLRFMIDSFLIGQMSGPMFLFFTYALYSLHREGIPLAGRFGFFTGLNSLLKIGPALTLLTSVSAFGRSPIIPLVSRIGIFFAAPWMLLWLLDATLGGFGQSFTNLIAWTEMLKADSSFFDAAHYGSQSFNSALLRLGFSVPMASLARIILGALFIAVGLRKTSQVGPFFSFSYWILGYLILMPFTFKYSLIFLAFPLTWLCERAIVFRRLPTIAALIWATLTLSAAGLDIVGPTLFFAIQKWSLPTTALLGLWFALLSESGHPDPELNPDRGAKA